MGAAFRFPVGKGPAYGLSRATDNVCLQTDYGPLGKATFPRKRFCRALAGFILHLKTKNRRAEKAAEPGGA